MTVPAEGGAPARRLDPERAAELERTYDSELQFRALDGPARWFVSAALVVLSVFHYYTAGFGIVTEHWHKSIHLAAVLGIIFLVFPGPSRAFAGRLGGVPLVDWGLAAAVAAAALYLPLVFDDLTFRIGAPNTADVAMGSLMVALTLEAARRAMGPILPGIVVVFILYALFGDRIDGVLSHPGNDWEGLINHVYLTQEGIFGIPAKVVSTFVFHFVLFGVIATRMGLGQFFIDLAAIVAGRYPGGPAKVAVVSSALFGSISGSSIANTVTTGSLTIPAMKKIGYRPHFAGAVEAAASAGGQITPPIMGAAAFVMIEFLEIPLTTLLAAAAVPALMHFLGVFVQVHFEAKRLGLRGMEPEDLPRLGHTVARGWPTVIPLVILVWTIVAGYTPYLAAFHGITACIVVGFLNPRNRLTLRDLWHGFETGARYALAVGAAAAAVGIVVGVITLTGAGFRVGFIVTQAAQRLAEHFVPLMALLPDGILTPQGLTLFLTLLFVALVCVAMGAGIPTTALYIVLAAMAAPAVTGLGVPPLAAHLFILYYGILADLTPPVCVAAYAAAGIAGSNPFRTGLTAFRLGLGKALVPFVFAYAPVMLIVLPGFGLGEFLLVTLSCAAGVAALGIAMTGFLFAPLSWPARLPLIAASLLMISPSLNATLIGLALVAPVALLNWIAARRRSVQALSG
ncbi:TRAP transporter permease [Elioraea sp. Yellowstone]|jgi:TRAP transporter 4TM/12TM fusion protein|uniref:TRAP transporter permease n=1 Tax=Elioraea sp. Yellowstone TaxID=2592070 RepID=UPI001152EB06|nr:TRAP transporter permease [Elioraea sp. Yellowstone]TQF80664.1 TRAP transporter permease [Elioraea sp. Yellowstone]